MGAKPTLGVFGHFMSQAACAFAHSWNSTFEMLRSCDSSREAICLHQEQRACPAPLEELDLDDQLEANFLAKHGLVLPGGEYLQVLCPC
jgi:hypothetical protein